MAARIDEPAIIMLAVQFDQSRCQIAQQARAAWLVIDKGFGAAIGFHLATDQQRLPRLKLNLGFVQSRFDCGG